MYTAAQRAAEMVMDRAAQWLGDGASIERVRGERAAWVRLSAGLYRVSAADVERELGRGVDGASWA